MSSRIVKSKKRVRDHGEVFTPDFIVNDMLDLVYNETQRIESRFFEPACGDGNFLIKILEKKLDVVERNYKKNQFDFEKYSLLAISSLYGVELLEDNTLKARVRLYEYFCMRYKKLYRKNANNNFLKNIEYLLNRNIIQGDALTLKDPNEDPIVFSEWSLANGKKIKRRDFQYSDLTTTDQSMPSLFSVQEISDNGEVVFSPLPVKEYSLVNFMEIYKSYE
ncbi:DNA methyltransferase [Patescibacteria group bacterium]